MSSNSSTNFTTPALVVARRQKRLQYWNSSFGNSTSDVREKLDTYRQLISKLARAESQQMADDCERKLQTLEREMISAFEALRLMTDASGIPAISD